MEMLCSHSTVLFRELGQEKKLRCSIQQQFHKENKHFQPKFSEFTDRNPADTENGSYLKLILTQAMAQMLLAVSWHSPWTNDTWLYVTLQRVHCYKCNLLTPGDSALAAVPTPVGKEYLSTNHAIQGSYCSPPTQIGLSDLASKNTGCSEILTNQDANSP